jgi:hypothetical protein
MQRKVGLGRQSGEQSRRRGSFCSELQDTLAHTGGGGRGGALFKVAEIKEEMKEEGDKDKKEKEEEEGERDKDRGEETKG